MDNIILNYMKIIIELLDVIAWPLTVLILINIFREPLIELLFKIKKFKTKDLEIDISRDIKKAYELASESNELTLKFQNDFFNSWTPVILAETSHSAAIIEAWKNIESAGMKAILRQNPEFEIKSYSAVNFAKYLHAINLISSTSVGVIEYLRRIRNQAIHEPNFKLTKNELNEYLKTSIRIYIMLDSISQ